jgi:hypothetical protein
VQEFMIFRRRSVRRRAAVANTAGMQQSLGPA